MQSQQENLCGGPFLRGLLGTAADADPIEEAPLARCDGTMAAFEATGPLMTIPEFARDPTPCIEWLMFDPHKIFEEPFGPRD